MAEDIFKDFTPEEIAKAYEELCDELCNIKPQIFDDLSGEQICCDDEANETDAKSKRNDDDDKHLAGTDAPKDLDGKARADSIIACMASVEQQMSSMSDNSSKMTALIGLKYLIEELYYHYLVLGQYYEGKHAFVVYMQTELAAGGTRASNAQERYAEALKTSYFDDIVSDLNKNHDAEQKLKDYTDQASYQTNSGYVGLEMRIDSGLKDVSYLPQMQRDYEHDNRILIFNGKGRQNNGTLYTTYLDAAGHLDDIFTLEERGLSLGTPDPSLVGTGAEGYMDKYIGNLSNFNEFFSNFKSNFEKKMVEKRAALLDLAFDAGGPLRIQAEHEAANRIALTGYQNALDWSLDEGSYYNDILSQVEKDLNFVIAEIKYTEDDLMSSGKAVTGITCLGKSAPDPDPNKKADPPVFDNDDSAKSGGLDFADTINFPNLTDMAYWRRFSTIATLVGLLPLPGPGLFRYWPIGLILPPALRIPLPIIWLPIKAIPTPFGVFVFFIGLSGIFPSPFLFYIAPTGQKSFLVSITPTLPFGTDSSKPPIKSVNLGGVSFPVPIFKGKEINSSDSTNNMLDTFVAKSNERIAVKQSDLVNYNAAQDKATVLKDIFSRSVESLDFSWSYPSGSSKVNPKTSDAQTLKDTRVGDAKSALAGISILGKLGSIQAPKLPFGNSQKPIKIQTSEILPVILSNVNFDTTIIPESPHDLKTIISESVSGSLPDVSKHFSAILAAADSFSAISPKTIPEAFKLPKLEFSNSTVSEIDPGVLDIAKKVLSVLSLVPYPAVAFLPQIFKQLHPILANDDLPPWERLSLKNFLFVAFLDDFCKTGKMGSLMPL